nr:MAG TPA_asm: hypothetical protein [Bacteriophage sp.]DAX95342.1 MAG TPA: hypothetical protein [Caudoviricetes sp.]
MRGNDRECRARHIHFTTHFPFRQIISYQHLGQWVPVNPHHKRGNDRTGNNHPGDPEKQSGDRHRFVVSGMI